MKNMKKSLTDSKRHRSEEELDAWLLATDLSELSSKIKFKRVSFPELKPTDWNRLYADFQKSTPINIRLPNHFIHRIKIASIQQGIPYQTLIKQWISDKLNASNQ
jgi:predicted DNA binding CopG/RHH family protein